MIDESTLDRAPTRPSLPSLGIGKDVVARLKHLAIASAISLVMLIAVFLDPIDQLSWVFQSRIANQAPSGDIVFVEADRDLTDPNVPERREEIAAALTELNRQGVGRVYLDLPIHEPSAPEVDKVLADAIAELGPRIVLVDRLEPEIGRPDKVFRTLPEIADNTRRVVSRIDENWMGFVWHGRFSHEIQGQRYPSLAASLAGIEDLRPNEFEIDYAIHPRDIPTALIQDVIAGKNVTRMTGRSVVIGVDASLSDVQQRIPGNPSVPASYVSIYGAETLKSGRTIHIASSISLVAYLLILAAVILLGKTSRRRYLGYTALAASVPIALYLGTLVGIRMELSYCVSAALIYGALRSRARWKDRVALVDNETNLPKLQALEETVGRDVHVRGHLVVARIHGYEHVLKTLPRSDRAHYIHKLVDRLRATDGQMKVYFEGHHLAWHSMQEDSALLAEHLEGLRAMFAAPVKVAGSSVDVGISFGVAKIDGDPAARLAAAVAAAEESSEALQPIKIAESNSRFDELWDISLRARIDQAMAAGEIFCVYQPKIDTRNNTMTGVEALVRWQDPSRGFIPPMHFIAQCEKAGRMEALTEYVLEKSCSAARLMHFRGRSITMSVNISATLLSDMRIVGMVRNVLQATGFDPRFLVLEVTETSRIGNLETAEMVLNELKSLGARISMDDFGVGETNFETFFELPFDELKVDRLFVANMAKSAKAKAIVTSIVEMGREARIGVVAEGAEDLETVKMLTEIGCTHVQGYVLARPMSLDNLMEFNNLSGDGALEA